MRSEAPSLVKPRTGTNPFTTKGRRLSIFVLLQGVNWPD